MSSRTIDPNLFHRAERAQRDTTAFLEQSHGTISKVVVRISEQMLRETAGHEAKRVLESGLGAITLTPHELSPGMTRIAAEMSEQYAAWKGNVTKHLASLNGVISDIESEANKIEHADIPSLETDKNRELIFADQKFESSAAYSHNREEYEAEKGRFEKLRTYNKQNFPKRVNLLLYWLVLFAVGFGDMYINYQVFLSKFELAIAIIITAIIGGLVAVISHVHGKYFRQRKLLFSLDVDVAERKELKTEVVIATIVFIGLLGFIFWARYSYFSQGSGLDFSSGGLLSTEFILSRIGPTIFFNLLVWFAGSVIAFFAHERVPGLRETYMRWRQLDAALGEMQKDLDEQKTTIERKFDIERQALEGRLAECQARLTNLRASKEQLNNLDQNYTTQIMAQGSALLRKYAELLCAQITRVEGDASSVAFISPKRGRLSMLEFEATEFAIPL